MIEVSKWLLRSDSNYSDRVTVVGQLGDIYGTIYDSLWDKYGVRPAIYVEKK